MRVRFLRSYRFAENGYLLRDFTAGEEADVTASCADSAMQDGAAEAIEQPVDKQLPPSPKRAVKPKPKTK